MDELNLKSFYRSLNTEERRDFAGRAGTSTNYIECQLIPRRKQPRADTMRSLANASKGALTYEDVVRYFLLSEAA